MALEPILYSFRRCPYAIRSRLALVISETPCALREVHLARKPSEMLAVSPKGTVPVLAFADGTVIDESLLIMRWALGRNDPEGWLERDDAELIRRNDGLFKHDVDRYKYPDRHRSDAFAHRQSGLQFLRSLNLRLSHATQLCGAVRGIADAAIMPFVRQFAAVDQNWFAAQPIPYLQAWLANHLASPLFSIAMESHAPWSHGDRTWLLPSRLAGEPAAQSPSLRQS